MPETYQIRGEIVIPQDAAPFKPARVLVELEDISRADAPSEVIASIQVAAEELRGGDVIPFALEVPADVLDEKHLYSVRAHLDVSGSGEIERQDYITTQTYPVLTRGYGSEVRVAVRKV